MVYGVLSGLIFLNIQLQWNMECDSGLFWIPKYVSQGWMCILRPVEFSTAKRTAWWLNEAARSLTQSEHGGGGSIRETRDFKSDNNSFWTLEFGWNTMLRIRHNTPLPLPTPTVHCMCVWYNVASFSSYNLCHTFLFRDGSIAALCLRAWILSHCTWRRPRMVRTCWADSPGI